MSGTRRAASTMILSPPVISGSIELPRTEGCAADRTFEQLREPAQRIADRIEALTMNRPEPASPAA